MCNRDFHLRLACKYELEENRPVDLTVEVATDDGWEPLDLNPLTPGFLVYVYSIFTCQHLHLRTGSSETGLGLESARGEIMVTTNDDWYLQKISVLFDVHLKSGTADGDTIESIASRMQACPVSKNLPAGLEVETRVNMK